MSLRHGIPGLLNYKPSTGYEINTFFKQSLAFFWQAQTSQIYRELNKLESDGLAESEMVIQRGKPNKKVYSITEAALAEMKTVRKYIKESSRKENELFWNITADFGFQYYESCIKWAKNALKQIEAVNR
jgi:DNA-binding PadR family transcriptional regulator